MELRVKPAAEYESELISQLRDCSLIPIVGSGVSAGVRASRGSVPGGEEYRKYMISQLKASPHLNGEDKLELERSKFSAVANAYEDDALISDKLRLDYFYNNFYGAGYEDGDIRRKLYDISWPYIYSLNIDDAIERSTSYREVIQPGEAFRQDIFDKAKCVLKLHGDISSIIKYEGSKKVFTSKEYAQSLRENRPMLTKLEADFASANMLFVGCSLEDELDLLSLETLPLYNGGRDILPSKKNYIFVKGYPSALKKSSYRSFGITDVVVFEDYDSMYMLLENVWKRSQELPPEQLSEADFSIKRLSPKDKENQRLFYQALNLVDYKTGTVKIPHYLIERDCTNELLKGLTHYGIQIIIGNRFSGKSYLLAGLYSRLEAQGCLLFDGRSRISNEAFAQLLERDRSILLFDTDAISREQLERMLDKQNELSKRRISIIVVMQSHDTDRIGLIRLKMEESKLSYVIIQEKNTLSASLSRSEVKSLNQRLPETHLQPCLLDKNGNAESMLNHLIRTADIQKTKGKYTDIRIPQDDTKRIAFYIAMATKNVLSYQDIHRLEFADIIGEELNRCAPMIEEVPTWRLERSGRDMSGMKYILNSKYWLRRELEMIAASRWGYEKITDAYRYLVLRLIDFSKVELTRRREVYKKYIYFDSINDIFGGAKGGKRELIAGIYSGLEDILGTDYQYNHQRAKCLMYNAAYTHGNKKLEYERAREAGMTAETQVQNEIRHSGSEKLRVSLAHIQYTLASICATLCELYDYRDIADVEKAIERCYEAVINPYNEEDFYRDKEKHLGYGVIYFIRMLQKKDVLSRLHSSEAIMQYNEVFSRVMRKR